jgi:glycosyltransferase involved in cell wall biosynthesis
MRILIVHDYATLTGGAEIHMQQLRAALRERGHDARLLASSAPAAGAAGRADYECYGTTSRLRTLLQTANPWAFFRLRQVLATFRPEVVHVAMFLTQLSPLILPLLRRVPSLYHVLWYRPICPLGTKRLPDGRECHSSPGLVCRRERCLPWHDWLPLMVQMKLWCHWRPAFRLVVANSFAVQKRLLAEGIQDVEVVWGGSPDLGARPPLEDPPTVGFAGRLVREKGVDVLLRAFALVVRRLPAAQLIIAGDGPEAKALHTLAEELRLDTSVTWLGHLPPAELEQRLRPAWVQVVPSLWAEPFGMVATEAMIRGTAVVASSTGGLAEIVQHGQTGLAVPPGDVAALADDLLQLLGDRGRAEEMGRAGRRLASDRFAWAAHVDRFLQLYQRLVRTEGAVRVAS